MTAETGSMFHVTNVTTTICLENVDFNYSSDSNVFLDASADSWGSAGNNGGNVTLNLKNQSITGAILSDSVSSVTVNLDDDPHAVRERVRRKEYERQRENREPVPQRRKKDRGWER